MYAPFWRDSTAQSLLTASQVLVRPSRCLAQMRSLRPSRRAALGAFQRKCKRCMASFRVPSVISSKQSRLLTLLNKVQQLNSVCSTCKSTTKRSVTCYHERLLKSKISRCVKCLMVHSSYLEHKRRQSSLSMTYSLRSWTASDQERLPERIKTRAARVVTPSLC